MREYHRVYAEVDLDAVTHNMEAMQANLTAGTDIMGVVKADGYGHGAVPVARAIDPYVAAYAVATAEEALQLRSHGITKPILVLGVVPADTYEELVRHHIRLTVFQYEKAKRLSETALSSGEQAYIHVALDTGMSRIGFEPAEASADEVKRMSLLPGVVVEGLFTHFATADETDKEKTREQFRKYQTFVGFLKQRGVEIPILHCSNSAGIIELKEVNLDMVRAGISIYGLYPSDEVDKEAVSLKPAMALRARVTYVKQIQAGTQVSYGGTFTADQEMTVATVPVGYGDGYPRNLSGRGDVLIRGKRARILGRVCMDQLMVDVTGIPEAAEEDLVTLIGRDGKEEITVEELAFRGGGFHYEILCDIGKRVPRVYLLAGKVVGAKDYFNDRYEDF